MIETRPDLQDLLNEPYRLIAIMEEEVTKMIESHLTAKEAKVVTHELKRRVWQHEFGLPPRRRRLDVHEELSSPVVSDIDSDRDIDLPSLTPVPGTYPIQKDDLRTPSPRHVYGGSTFKVPSSDTDSDISPTPSSQDSDDDKENEPPASYSPIPFNLDSMKEPHGNHESISIHQTRRPKSSLGRAKLQASSALQSKTTPYKPYPRKAVKPTTRALPPPAQLAILRGDVRAGTALSPLQEGEIEPSSVDRNGTKYRVAETRRFYKTFDKGKGRCNEDEGILEEERDVEMEVLEEEDVVREEEREVENPLLEEEEVVKMETPVPKRRKRSMTPNSGVDRWPVRRSMRDKRFKGSYKG